VEPPLIDGFRLSLTNESRVVLNKAVSGWSNKSVTPFVFEKFNQRPQYVQGEERPNDYIIFFGDAGFGSSDDFRYNNVLYPSMPVNFKVYNNNNKKFIKFGFLEVGRLEVGSCHTVAGASDRT